MTPAGLPPQNFRENEAVMVMAAHFAALGKTRKEAMAIFAEYHQDRIDDEGCGAVIAAARWPLVQKRKKRHKM